MATRLPSPPTVACFGEALWDVLPAGIFLGGAPLNVAYHLSRHGTRVLPISAVGDDFLGEEIRRRITSWGMSAAAISVVGGRPTGTVRAQLDPDGVAKYHISRDVAWDRIDVASVARQPAPAALVFGTLALRSAFNREQLGTLFTAWPGAIRVVDLNLRPPFDQGQNVQFALKRAAILKLNHDELGRMLGRPASAARRLEKDTRTWSERSGLARICVTAGGLGAGLLWDGKWFWEPGRKVEVRDTIGAGDAFLAGFLHAILENPSRPGAALARAGRVGEFVAGSVGATPPYRVGRGGMPHALRG